MARPSRSIRFSGTYSVALSAWNRVDSYPSRWSRASSTESDGGNSRVGPVGRPSRRAAAVSTGAPGRIPAVSVVVRGPRVGNVGRGGGGGTWASRRAAPPKARQQSTTPAAATERTLRRQMTIEPT